MVARVPVVCIVLVLLVLPVVAAQSNATAGNVTAEEFPDRDQDGYRDDIDRCPDVADDQQDLDGDGVGDACDQTPAPPPSTKPTPPPRATPPAATSERSFWNPEIKGPTLVGGLVIAALTVVIVLVYAVRRGL